MSHDLSQQVPPRGDGTQDSENRRIAALADELQRLCAIYETQSGTGTKHVNHLEAEQRAAEQMAKAQGFF